MAECVWSHINRTKKGVCFLLLIYNQFRNEIAPTEYASVIMRWRDVITLWSKLFHLYNDIIMTFMSLTVLFLVGCQQQLWHTPALTCFSVVRPCDFHKEHYCMFSSNKMCLLVSDISKLIVHVMDRGNCLFFGRVYFQPCRFLWSLFQYFQTFLSGRTFLFCFPDFFQLLHIRSVNKKYPVAVSVMYRWMDLKVILPWS